MTLVADLSAGILFYTQLTDVDGAVAKRDVAVGPDDGRALESRGNAAVQVLLAGDVDLADELSGKRTRHY